MALMSLEQVIENLTTADRSLLYHMLVQQMETNRLLTLLVEKEQEQTVDIDTRKRPELMKAMGKREDAPQGWNKWSNEKIVEFLKGEQ